MSNTPLSIEEIMEYIFINPELSWEQQLRGLKLLEQERLEEGVSVSQWGHHVAV
jgi:hypothetical protein